MSSQTSPDELTVIKTIVGSARTDVQKISSAAETLKHLTNQAVLDRSAIRVALSDLKAAVEAGKWTSIGAILALYAKFPPAPDSANSQTQTATQVGGLFVGLSNAISDVVSTINNPAIDEAKIREAVAKLYWPYIDFSILFGKISHVLDLDPVGGLGWIHRLLKLPALSLNENWAVATCYLAAMEVAVNRVVKSEGLTEDREEEFQDKFSRILSILGKKGRHVTGLQRLLPAAFWKLRNDVIHAGYSPTSQEMDLLLPWVSSTIKALTEPTISPPHGQG